MRSGGTVAIAFVVALAGSSRPLPAHGQAFSLAAAIAEAPSGATIEVPAGTYSGGIVITKPLTLRGRPGAVIDARGAGNVVRIAASHVTVQGFVLRNSGRSLTDENAGIFIDQTAGRVTVADNDLEHVLFGIYLNGSKDTKVVGNQIRGMTELRVPDRGDGIHLWNDTGAVIANNDVGDTRDGIYIYVSHNNRIVGNRIHDVRYGVHYMYSNFNRLQGNVSYRNVAGYALMMSDHLQVYDNQAYDDTSYGILLNYITYSELVGNRIRTIEGRGSKNAEIIPGAEGKGLFVYDSSYDRFEGNEIADCRIGIHATAGSSHNIFTDNAFIANRTQVKYVQNVTEEWSWRGRGNYWSDYRGWDLNDDGIGDIPYRPNDGVDALFWNYPDASLLMSSPAALALRYVQRAFPVFVSPGVEDNHPLMRPPSGRRDLQRSARNSRRN